MLSSFCTRRYSWCRAVDDLIDEASSPDQAATNLRLISAYLDLAYDSPLALTPRPLNPDLSTRLKALLSPLPASSRSPFRLLIELPIPRAPLDELVAGFRTDLAFAGAGADGPGVVATEEDLEIYASNVAASVAELCVRLAWARTAEGLLAGGEAREVVAAAREMGRALQLVNIARDVPADAKIGRVYLPGVSLDSVRTPEGLANVTEQRLGLLRRARAMAATSVGAIGRLPREVRGGMRAACQVYLEIGEAVEEALVAGRIDERARVSTWRRVRTAWRALA